MARPKKVQKVKEPVRIRQRKLANGNMSLYLDVYVKGVRKVESLGLYLVPETTPIDRQQNNHARQVAPRKSKPSASLHCRTTVCASGTR